MWLAWILNIDTLKSILGDASSMKVNTAASLLAAGLALALLALRGNRDMRLRNVAAAVLAILIVVAGALTLGEYLCGCDLKIDQALFRQASPQGPYPGRMSPSTSLCFVFAGLALLSIALRFPRAGVTPRSALSPPRSLFLA